MTRKYRICQSKPWRNEDFNKDEEALPRLKDGDLGKVSRLYKAKTGVGCDGFHPKVPMDLTKETRREIVEFLEKVEQSGKNGRNKPARRCIDGNGKILLEEQKHRIKGLWRWFWHWRRLLSESDFLWSGPGRRNSASQERSCGYFVGTFSTRGECSSKDVRRNCCRPLRPSCRGQSGVVCFFVLYCRVR